MINQRVNRVAELEYLLKLYKFCADNSDHLRFNDDFRKVLEAQEAKIAHLFNEIVSNREEN